MTDTAVDTPFDISEEHREPYPGLAPSRFPEVAGKTVIITGGARGIGKAYSRAFAEAGAKHIYILGRDTNLADIFARELHTEHPQTTVSVHCVDISVPNTIHEFFDSLQTPAHVLINNAGHLAQPTNFVDADLREWWKAFEVNVLGMATMTQSYIRHRRQHKPGGVGIVINANTMGAFSIQLPAFTSYCSTKAASLRFQELITVDVPPTEIRFHSLYPGSIATDMAKKSGLGDLIPKTDPRVPGQFALFLATEQAGFLNGRMTFAGWDVDKLLAHKDTILAHDLFRTSIGH